MGISWNRKIKYMLSLKDVVFHHYGCKVLIVETTYWMMHTHCIRKGDIMSLNGFLLDRFLDPQKIDSIKVQLQERKKPKFLLLLRSILSMTAQEKEQLWTIDSDAQIVNDNSILTASPDALAWLCLNNFDAFGLIFRGWALPFDYETGLILKQ